MSQIQEAIQRFQEIAEKNGMAVTATTDGYVFMFKRERLLNMLLGSTSPALEITIGIGNGEIKSVQMDRNKLQAEVDAQPDQPMIMVIYTHEPINN